MSKNSTLPNLFRATSFGMPSQLDINVNVRVRR